MSWEMFSQNLPQIKFKHNNVNFKIKQWGPNLTSLPTIRRLDETLSRQGHLLCSHHGEGKLAPFSLMPTIPTSTYPGSSSGTPAVFIGPCYHLNSGQVLWNTLPATDTPGWMQTIMHLSEHVCGPGGEKKTHSSSDSQTVGTNSEK